MSGDREFTWQEIAKHNTINDMWIAINGIVYDVTNFIWHHPGGKKAFYMVAGGDATHAYKSYHKHSPTALLQVGKQYKIGRLAPGQPDFPSTNNTYLSCGNPPGRQALPLAPFPKDDANGNPSIHPPGIQSPGIFGQVKNGLVSLMCDVAGFGIKATSTCVVEPLASMHRFVRPIRGIPKNADGTPTKVAIIGAGCSGMSAAWLFEQTEGFEYTVFESQNQVGGHAYTVDYESKKNGQKIHVDLGFIFAGWYTYSNLVEMMKKIGAEPVESELSTIADVYGYQYASDTPGIVEMNGFGKEKKKEWMHPIGKSECLRFQALCERFYENALFNLIPFHVFLDIYGFGQDFRDLYLKPTLVLLFIGEHMVFNMPCRLIFNMFAGNNKQADLVHGFPCFTIKGGNRSWLIKLAKTLRPGSIRLSTTIREVTRVTDRSGRNRVLIRTENGELQEFDHVMFACGAKAAAHMLQNKSALEQYVFKQIRYETGAVMVLHNDHSFIEQFAQKPEDRKRLRTFNYRAVKGMPQCEVSGIYHEMSQQKPTTDAKPFTEEYRKESPIVTFNPLRKINGEVFHEKYCVIHQEDIWHLLVTRTLLPMMQGQGNVWYGATWCNWIGHASGIDAGMVIATRLGANNVIESPIARDIYFDMAARDMLGHRFDWRRSVREKKPILKSAL